MKTIGNRHHSKPFLSYEIKSERTDMIWLPAPLLVRLGYIYPCIMNQVIYTSEMSVDNKRHVPLRAYTLKGLAVIYEVDYRTFKKWLKPFECEIGEKEGYLYKIPQVKLIFQKLSLPGNVIIDP